MRELAAGFLVEREECASERRQELRGHAAAGAVAEIDGHAKTPGTDLLDVKGGEKVIEVAISDAVGRPDRPHPVPAGTDKIGRVVDVEKFSAPCRVEKRPVGADEFQGIPAGVVVAAGDRYAAVSSQLADSERHQGRRRNAEIDDLRSCRQEARRNSRAEGD